jgi:hypothetical protein
VNVSHKWGSANRENRGVASRNLIDKLWVDIQETEFIQWGFRSLTADIQIVLQPLQLEHLTALSTQPDSGAARRGLINLLPLDVPGTGKYLGGIESITSY